MVVQSDNSFLCSGCKTTVERDVTYQIQNFSGSNAGTTSICETPTFSGWNCTQAESHSYRNCSAPSTTDSSGVFTDEWSMTDDAYKPVGCGFSIVDHWDWAAHSPVQSLGTLTGYVHTNAVSIDGVVSKPQQDTDGNCDPLLGRFHEKPIRHTSSFSSLFGSRFLLCWSTGRISTRDGYR